MVLLRWRGGGGHVFAPNTVVRFVFTVFTVSDENLKKNIKQMEKQFKQLETDLKSIKKGVEDKDKFSDVMNISFFKARVLLYYRRLPGEMFVDIL